MTALSMLPAAGQLPALPANALTRLADRLAAHKLQGTPFCEAWNECVRHTRGLHAYTQPADDQAPSPLDFARVRFEAAYHGEDYSRPTCSEHGCVELSYRAGLCRLHCPLEA